MSTSFILAASIGSAMLFSIAVNAAPVQPSKYLTGSISHDVAGALQRGVQEHKPVWIIAWDDKFEVSPEGRKGASTDYYLSNFYGNSETKKIIAGSFIQVFTSVHNPAIAAWIDPADVSRAPRAIIIDSNGKLLHRQGTSANAGDGLKDVQKVVEMLSNPTHAPATK